MMLDPDNKGFKIY